MKAMEAAVRSIEKDGLVWGASKLVPVGYGLNKLEINLVVEDEKVSTSDLQEEIEAFEDYVQSTDIVSSQLRSMWMKLMLTLPTPVCYAKAVKWSYEQSFSSRTGIRPLHDI